MISTIGIVDVVYLQNTLDESIGVGIFTVKNNKSVTPPEYFIEYADNTPAQQVNQALSIAQTQATDLLNDTKVRLYQAIQITANEQIELLAKPNFTDTQIQQANDWLQNQSQPVPACVSYLALLQSMTNVQAAQYIVDSKTNYDNLINQIKALQNQGQTAVMNTTNTYDAKVTANNYQEQIKNIQ